MSLTMAINTTLIAWSEFTNMNTLSHNVRTSQSLSTTYMYMQSYSVKDDFVYLQARVIMTLTTIFEPPLAVIS